MHFSAFAASVIAALSISLATAPVGAGFIGYSGFECDGNAGSDVPCDGTCITTPNNLYKSSFRVDGGSGHHYVTIYTDGGCPSGGQEFLFQNQDGQCTGLNNGAPTGSFRCSPNNICIT